MNEPVSADSQELVERLNAGVLEPLKAMFVGKDEIIDLLAVSLVAGENLFLLGPPGTAKSALVQALAGQLDGRMFDYLLTRFTEPNELFGPFDIRKLREGELLTNTEGMLPEADFAFLDELLNANSAILNSLLMALNERVFRRGRETRELPTLMFVGASNRLPEDEALGALFDRFLLRVRCENVEVEQMHDVLVAGRKLQQADRNGDARMTTDDVRQMQRLTLQVDLSGVLPKYVDVVQRLRHAGIRVSDRRAVRLQGVMAGSALLCGRDHVSTSDMWVLRYIWDTEEQQEILASIVDDVLRETEDEPARHPRAGGSDAPDPEQLARDLERLEARFRSTNESSPDHAFHRDQLSLLAARCQWVQEGEKRQELDGHVAALWQLADGATAQEG